MIYVALTSLLMWATAHAATGSAKGGRAATANAIKPVVLPAGDPVAGRDKAEAERCFECHGAEGQGNGHPSAGPEGKFAKLAGQYPSYMQKQINDYKSGVRKNDFMNIMAKSVSDEDMRDILAYFASLPRMKGEGGGNHEAASKLFHEGDAARGVLACASCHGQQGKGIDAALAPVVGGQEWKYLQKQLSDWRSGFRKNSPDGVMNRELKSLTDAEIDALANYLTAQ